MKRLAALLRQHAQRLLMALTIVPLLLLHVAGVYPLDFLQRLENYSYDLRLRWTMPGGIDRRIVILDIDEPSLKELGHWPWPRKQLAQMMDLLFDHYQIDVLGFDVVFAERDTSAGLATLEKLAQTQLRGNAPFHAALQQLRPQLQYDQQFAASLKGRRVVLGYYFRHDQQAQAQVGQLPAPVFARGSFDASGIEARVSTGFTANLPELQQAAMSGGFFDATQTVDADGVFRRISLLQSYQGALYETLSLAMARLAMRQDHLQLVHAPGDASAVGLESLQLGQRRVPVDIDVAALVPYRGPQGSFVYVSATDVLHSRVAPEVLRGAIVLVGTTAAGLKDLRSTPVGESYAGVELHANMIAAILDGDIRARPAWVLGFEMVLLVLMGLGLVWLLPRLSPLRATLLSLALMLATVLGNLYFWQQQLLILPLASMVALVTSLFVFNMSYGYFVDSRAKRLLAKLFGQYVPAELVDEMAKDPGAYSLQGTNRELTVLFSDVRGFTSISEGLSPPQLAELMNEFLTPMTRVIHKHRGTIDKYMGDAIMAFWGAPVDDAEHPRHALQAALEMVHTLQTMDAHFQSRGWPPVRVGVGLNTGEMTVGNMGSEFRLAYTVMGDAVNLGSRLESLTRVYGVQIMVSEMVAQAVPEHAFLELDRVRVKGKEQPIRIFEPLGLSTALTAAQQQELQALQQALAKYRSQQWDAAEQAFNALQQQMPERKLYQIYLDRIAQFRRQPPASDWDGTHNFLRK